MLVFDASGSMSGSVGLGVATPVTRIDKVRSALAKVLPSATRFRRVGLITYGPGEGNLRWAWIASPKAGRSKPSCMLASLTAL